MGVFLTKRVFFSLTFDLEDVSVLLRPVREVLVGGPAGEVLPVVLGHGDEAEEGGGGGHAALAAALAAVALAVLNSHVGAAGVKLAAADEPAEDGHGTGAWKKKVSCNSSKNWGGG